MTRYADALLIAVVLLGVCFANKPVKRNFSSDSDKLVGRVLDNCSNMACVKIEVLKFLENILKISNTSNGRNVKNIDQAIFKRAARVMNSNEFKFNLPEIIFGGLQMVYSPISGLDFLSSSNADDEERGILKKKLFLPILLLLKLKLKALMPLFVLIAKIKAVKALIISKLALGLVIGFIIYQMMNKSGLAMPMAMTMAPIEPPSLYGPPPPSSPVNMYGPPPSTAPPSSYEPSWEPSPPGPYSRIWTERGDGTNSNNGRTVAPYSTYYSGSGNANSGNGLGSTLRPL